MSISQYQNDIYSQNSTMETIMSVDDTEIDNLEYLSKEAFYNTFAITSDIIGIQRYEKWLQILPDPTTQDLEFRRVRVIAKMSQWGALTKLYLQDLLTNTFGAGNWTLEVNEHLYTIYIDVVTTDKVLFNATMKDVRQVVPANMLLYERKEAVMTTDNAVGYAASGIFASIINFTIPTIRK